MIDTNPYFTARELAGMELPGFPHSRRKVNFRATLRKWPWRNRIGRGGGREYAFSDLPEDLRLAILRRRPELFVTKKVDDQSQKSESIGANSWDFFCRLPDKIKSVAERRLSILNRINDLVEDGGIRKSVAIRIIGEETGVSQATLFRWLSQVSGVDRVDLLPALVDKRKGGQIKSEIPESIWRYFKADYLRLEKPTLSSCYDRAGRIAKEMGLKIPSRKTFKRKLQKEIPYEVLFLARNGKKALERIYPAQIRDKSPLEALECVDIDGYTADFFCKWPDGTVARPVVVLIHDIYSSKITAYRIDKSENKDLIRLAFADQVKNYGIPKEIFLDNGRAFASKWISGGEPNRYRFKIKSEEPTGIFVSLGSKIRWVTPAHGQAKPIERAIRDFADYFSKAPELAGAYCGNTPLSKPENYKSRIPDLDLVWRVLDREVKASNARPGRRSPVCNGRSFDDVFFESYGKTLIRKATQEQLGLLLLCPEQPRTSRYDGSIEIDGNKYWAEFLTQHIGQKLTVRLDPQNLHQGLWVYDLKNSFLGFAECQEARGFKDKQAAREHARLKRHWIKATKAALKSEVEMSALEAASMLPEVKDPERSTAKVIGGLFGHNIELQRRKRERLDSAFEAGVADEKNMEEIQLRFAANP